MKYFNLPKLNHHFFFSSLTIIFSFKEIKIDVSEYRTHEIKKKLKLKT